MNFYTFVECVELEKQRALKKLEGFDNTSIGRGSAPHGGGGSYHASKQVVEFPVSEDVQTLTFPIEGFSGDGKVNFIFLPGSDFDLISFQFHE